MLSASLNKTFPSFHTTWAGFRSALKLERPFSRIPGLPAIQIITCVLCLFIFKLNYQQPATWKWLHCLPGCTGMEQHFLFGMHSRGCSRPKLVLVCDNVMEYKIIIYFDPFLHLFRHPIVDYYFCAGVSNIHSFVYIETRLKKKNAI